MYTAMAVVTLATGLATGNLSQNPTWLKDYQLAQAQVSQVGKPMVVFIGSGAAGQTAAVREGTFDPVISKLLSSKFVCLYVDTTTTSGRKLADAFSIKDVGVVISNRTGNKQAFSAATALASADLEKTLVKYADEPVTKPTEVVPAGGPVPAGGMVIQAGATMGGPGYGYGYGGYGYGGGCCGKGYGSGAGCGGGYGYGGGCCGKGGYGAHPVMTAAPGAPPAKVEMKAGAAPAMAPAPMMAAPMGYGYRGGYGGGGCCGWGGGYGGGCGKGYGGGYGYGGGCGKGYGGGGCCGW